MAIFNRFPFSNAHELNLDWILRQLRDLLRRVKRLEESGGGSGGTSDYDALDNKPSINGVTLEGNKTSAQLNIPVGPELANTMPLMDGTPQIGNSSRAAKADHVHPSDTSKTDIVAVRAEVSRQLNQYDPAEADYDPPYAAGTLGYAIENASIDPEDLQDAVDVYLDTHPALTGMFTNAAKDALIALLEKVAYVDGNGQQYLNELITNLAATVTSISAVFTQGDNIFCTVDTLDDLKPYLVVTASYSDGTSSVTNDYELSGTLEAGTSTITVSYGGQTDTFTVTGVRTATKLFAGAVWHFFGTSGTGSVSGSSDISASFNTTADTTAYTTGFGGDSSSPTSAYKTFGQIKGHRIRTYLNCNSVSGGNSTSNFAVSAYLGGIAYNGTRKKYKDAIRLRPLSTGNLFNDLIIPVSVWDETGNVWGGSGTVSDSDYFSIRAYCLTAVATSASFTIVLYDLGAET